MPEPSNSLVCHYASLLMTRIESQCLVGPRSAVHKHRVSADTEVLESSSIGKSPVTASSIDSELAPLKNVNVFSVTLVMS